MATCTPVAHAPKQATLFSFMKKKDPNEIAEAKAALNFVTPAEKAVAPVEVKAVELKEVEKEQVMETDTVDVAEADEDIERLVSRPSMGTPPPLPSPSVVDLTTAPEVDVKKNLLPSAVKPRRKAPKKAPKVAEKPIAASIVASITQLAAVTPEKEEAVSEMSSSNVEDDDAEGGAEADPQISAESMEVEAPVATSVAAVTPAPSAAKKRTRKPAAKKIEAAESAALDAEAGAGEDAEVIAPLDEEDAAGQPATKRVRKAPAKPAPAAVVYPPHVEVKLQANREKLSTLVQELVALERAEDCVDLELDIAQAAEDLVAAAQQVLTDDCANATAAEADSAAPASDGADSPTSGTETAETAEMEATPAVTEAPTTEDGAEVALADADAPASPNAATETAVPVQAAPLTAEEKAKAHVVALVKAFVARSVQGSSAPLREVVAAARAGLQAVYDRVVALTTSVDSTSTEDASIAPETRSSNTQLVLDALARLLDNVVLAEEIKILAARQSYGNRAEKSLMFDCADALAVWRWETLSPVYFTKTAQATLREVRAVRGRYSRALKAVYRVLEQLQKVPHSEAKLAPLEERSAKCMTEVEKAKEKRRETETKRAADAAEKRRKDELKEQKRIEKEEADRVRKAAAEAAAASKAAQGSVEKEKKAPVVNEKAQKKAQEIEKSKNMFMNFLKGSSSSASAPPSTSSSSAAASTALPAKAAVAPQKQSEVKTPSVVAEEQSVKLARFDAALQTDLPLSDIMKFQRERYQSRPTKHTARRPRYIDLHVTVIVPDTRARSAFDASDNTNTFSEIQEKTFHNKMRTLSFWEDHRPAYVGTVSRKSRVICGRRPFAKDTELLNYDYDSEEDWEEEVEGEDLNETDEEEEEAGANELEYDDFFCRDDDYGSDAEGDMDGAAMKVCQRNVIEVFGPRFVDPALLPAVLVEPPRAEDGAERATAGAVAATPAGSYTRKLDEPISTFSIFDLSTGELRSQAAKGDADANNLSSYTAVCYTTFPVPTLGLFETKRSTQGGVGAAGEPAEAKAPKGFDESKLPELAKYVHGKKEGLDKLVLGFHALHPMIPKLQIQKRIKEITDKTKHADGYGTSRFVIKPEMIEKLQIQAEELEAVIFTPQKKKKRAAVTVVASSLEELLAQQGEKAALFPAQAPAAHVTQVSSSPATAAESTAAVQASATSSSSPAPPAALLTATKPKAAKPKIAKAAPASASSAGAVTSTSASAQGEVKTATAQKRKVDASAPAPAPKKRVVPTSVPPAASVAAPLAAPTTAAASPAVAVAAAVAAPVAAASSAATVPKAVAAVSGVKKITSFLLSPGAKAAGSTSSASTAAVSGGTGEQGSNEPAKVVEPSPASPQIVIEIDME